LNDEIITNSNENTHRPGTGPEKTRFEKAALVVPGWKKPGSNKTNSRYRAGKNQVPTRPRFGVQGQEETRFRDGLFKVLGQRIQVRKGRALGDENTTYNADRSKYPKAIITKAKEHQSTRNIIRPLHTVRYT
jgi:hypothetical protein